MRLFYESALTDHENAFLNISQTHEKVYKNAWTASQLKTNAKEYHSFTDRS